MTPRRPILIIPEASVPHSCIASIVDMASQIIQIGQAHSEVIDLSDPKRQTQAATGRGMYDYGTSEKFEAMSVVFRRNDITRQINADSFLKRLEILPHQEAHGAPHYLYVTTDDIGNGKHDCLITWYFERVGAVISLRRFREANLSKHDLDNLAATCAAHALGHVFGLIPRLRTEAVDDAGYGIHCTNRCVMRHRDLRPKSWFDLNHDRLEHGAFCHRCTSDLQEYFEHI